MTQFFGWWWDLLNHLRSSLSDAKLTDIVTIVLIYMQIRIYRDQSKIMNRQSRILSWQYTASIQDMIDENDLALKLRLD